MDGVIKVTDEVWRGPRPDGPEYIATLQKELGIKSILNLESGFFERSHRKLNEEFLTCVQLGITPYHLEMSDIFPPNRMELWMGVKLMMAPENRPIYVHCLHGVDRTGAMIAAYRAISGGWSIAEALAEMKAMGFHVFPYWWWIPRINEDLLRGIGFSAKESK